MSDEEGEEEAMPSWHDGEDGIDADLHISAVNAEPFLPFDKRIKMFEAGTGQWEKPQAVPLIPNNDSAGVKKLIERFERPVPEPSATTGQRAIKQPSEQVMHENKKLADLLKKIEGVKENANNVVKDVSDVDDWDSMPASDILEKRDQVFKFEQEAIKIFNEMSSVFREKFPGDKVSDKEYAPVQKAGEIRDIIKDAREYMDRLIEDAGKNITEKITFLENEVEELNRGVEEMDRELGDLNNRVLEDVPSEGDGEVSSSGVGLVKERVRKLEESIRLAQEQKESVLNNIGKLKGDYSQLEGFLKNRLRLLQPSEDSIPEVLQQVPAPVPVSVQVQYPPDFDKFISDLEERLSDLQRKFDDLKARSAKGENTDRELANLLTELHSVDTIFKQKGGEYGNFVLFRDLYLKLINLHTNVLKFASRIVAGVWEMYRKEYTAMKELIVKTTGTSYGPKEMERLFKEFLEGLPYVGEAEIKRHLGVFGLVQRGRTAHTPIDRVSFQNFWGAYWKMLKKEKEPGLLVISAIRESLDQFRKFCMQWKLSNAKVLANEKLKSKVGNVDTLNVISSTEDEDEPFQVTKTSVRERARKAASYAFRQVRVVSSEAAKLAEQTWKKYTSKGKKMEVDTPFAWYATEGNPNSCTLCAWMIIAFFVFIFTLFVSCIWWAQQIYSPTYQFYTYYPLAAALGAHIGAIATQRATPFLWCEIFFILLGFVMVITYAAEFGGMVQYGDMRVNGNVSYSSIAPGTVHNATIIRVTDTDGVATLDFINLNIALMILAMLWYLGSAIICIWAILAYWNDPRGRGFVKARIYTPLTLVLADDADKVRLAASFLSIIALILVMFELVLAFMAELGSMIIPSVFNMPDFFLTMMLVIAIIPPPPGVPFPEQDDYDAYIQSNTFRADRLLNFDEIMDIVNGYEYYLQDKNGNRRIDSKSDENGRRRREPNPAKAINIIWAQCAYENFQERSPSRNENLARELGSVTNEYIFFVIGLFLAVGTSAGQNITSWAWRGSNNLEAVCVDPTSFDGIVKDSDEVGNYLSYWDGAYTVAYFHNVSAGYGTFNVGFYRTITCTDDWVRLSILTLGFIVFLMHFVRLIVSLSRFNELKYAVTHPQEGRTEKLLQKLTEMFVKHGASSAYYRSLKKEDENLAPGEVDENGEEVKVLMNQGEGEEEEKQLLRGPEDAGTQPSFPGAMGRLRPRWATMGYGGKRRDISGGVFPSTSVDEFDELEKQMYDMPLLFSKSQEQAERANLKGY